MRKLIHSIALIAVSAILFSSCTKEKETEYITAKPKTYCFDCIGYKYVYGDRYYKEMTFCDWTDDEASAFEKNNTGRDTDGFPMETFCQRQ